VCLYAVGDLNDHFLIQSAGIPADMDIFIFIGFKARAWGCEEKSLSLLMFNGLRLLDNDSVSLLRNVNLQEYKSRIFACWRSLKFKFF
jgi:hypothetical protein